MNNDSVSDLIVGGLDAVLPLDKAQKSLIERVDLIIQDSVKQNDPDIAGKALNYLMGMSRISGLSLAKMIYTFKFQWASFNRRETCEAYLEDFCGVREVTSKRYYRIWEMLVSGDIPKEYSDKLKLLPVGCLISIATLWSQGYEIESHQWLKLSNAPDPSTVRKIIREIKGVEPKKGSLQLEWEAEAKTLTAWKDGTPHKIYLQYDENDDVILKAIARLIGDGRVMEK